MAAHKGNIYTVTQVNRYIKNMFTQDYMLQSLSVRGEVSNCKYHSSGHIYFTLKDAKGTLSCVMFAGNRSGLGFRMEEGQQVAVTGAVDVYERDGRYQMYARHISLDGIGALYEQFDRLKKELEELGMFAPEYKQPIPPYIKTLGVVTAETGAAVRDIIQIAKRRNPYVQIILYPAIVQGDAAAASIVKGIRALESLGVDLMIVGRGGGSIEDLWAFNQREVAQAVFDCRVPIISAVGHETDTTIVDFVSDLRAPTPSAAAELAVYDRRALITRLKGLGAGMSQTMARHLGHKRERSRYLELQLRYMSPESRMRERRLYAVKLEERLRELMESRLRDGKHRLALSIERLKRLSPLDKLESGYSYVENQKGENIRSVRRARVGDILRIRMKDGSILTRVEQVRQEGAEG